MPPGNFCILRWNDSACILYDIPLGTRNQAKNSRRIGLCFCSSHTHAHPLSTHQSAPVSLPTERKLWTLICADGGSTASSGEETSLLNPYIISIIPRANPRSINCMQMIGLEQETERRTGLKQCTLPTGMKFLSLSLQSASIRAWGFSREQMKMIYEILTFSTIPHDLISVYALRPFVENRILRGRETICRYLSALPQFPFEPWFFMLSAEDVSEALRVKKWPDDP